MYFSQQILCFTQLDSSSEQSESTPATEQGVVKAFEVICGESVFKLKLIKEMKNQVRCVDVR